MFITASEFEHIIYNCARKSLSLLYDYFCIALFKNYFCDPK